MIGPDQEALRPATGEGFSDAVTVAFGDAEAGVFGVARVGVVPGESTTASALAIVLADNAPVLAVARGGEPVQAPGWQSIEVAGVGLETVEPLGAWRASVRTPGPDGEPARLELDLRALCPPVELSPGSSAGRAGGMQGYEQLCRVTGAVTLGGRDRALDCLGQRGHAWGTPDWDRMTMTRNISAWLGDDLALWLTAIRPEGAKAHDAEAVSATLVDGEAFVELDEARLSTTWDDEERQRRAGLELWETEETEYPRRLAGEVVAGTTLDLGRLRLDCAFFSWHMEGRAGVGRYDVLRRT